MILLCIGCNAPDTPVEDYSGWSAYAGTKDGNRYSSGEQVNAANVAGLKLAWSWSSGDKDTGNRSQNQCNPVMIDGWLYGTTPKLKLFALDASTGKEQWLFDPATEDSTAKKDPYAYFKVSRGVMYWADGADKRIFYSVGSKTWCIDARNGHPVRSFGDNGAIDLKQGLDSEADLSDAFIVGTTPGVIYKDVMILGTRVGESPDAAPGHIRGYDVRTGKRKWIFHTIPHPGEKNYGTWPDSNAWKYTGGANSWAGMALDQKRGIVYVPTGSIGGDFYGGFRKGQNLYSNSLLALDAETGKYIWHYQMVHHDLWDRDLAANPNLLTITHNGKQIDVVAQVTKHGYVFVLDRETGNPVFPVEEKPFPVSDLAGEETWPTQPIPSLPEPFARNTITAEDITDRTPEVHTDMLGKFNRVKHNGMFAPPSKESSWIFPGYDGGGEWGGAAVDPKTGILYVNSSEMPWVLTMIDVKEAGSRSQKGLGATVYTQYCISCHGPDREGNGSSYPSLVDLSKKFTAEQVAKVIENGKNMMPSFKQITGDNKRNLLAYLMDEPGKEPVSNSPASATAAQRGRKNPDSSDAAPVAALPNAVPYAMTGYNRFVDRDGYPGIKPPWGTLNAIDLNTGKLLWKVPLGEYPELTRLGIPLTGTENYGGPLVTKGGLVFIAASKDAKLHAFDKTTGKLLWQAPLPVPGYATPATYTLNGRQFIVIACGGGKIGSRSGDTYMAFALP
ncbi:MAG: c-type cytochrome [Chitinophagaceae bacterium]|nr:MAG: c-type cytochrome [Chitinophagaceae bacterium]